MTYLIALLIGCSVAALTLLLAQLLPARPAALSRRLAELEQMTAPTFGMAEQQARRRRREQLEAIFQKIGERVQRHTSDAGVTQALLMHAGYRNPNAAAIYRGVRVGLPLSLAMFMLLLGAAAGKSGLPLALGAAAIGWILPAFYVGGKRKRRQKELQLALPDALDAMVVCVEAGLGLNQAMVRVAEEIRHISTLMSEELMLTNFEIRAGTPREDALRSLAERTGLDDIRSLVTMLIQTDRFGTSIAQALRVQSDTLREKRRQRAEEAAAKTAIKMLFPLIFFIFPAMWVITLGPAVIQLIAGWANRPLQ
jgi:tight adherence protein C